MAPITWIGTGECEIITDLSTAIMLTSGRLMLITTVPVTHAASERGGEAPQLGLLLTATPAGREVRTKPRKVCSDAWDGVKLANYQSQAVSLSWSSCLRNTHGSDRI